MELDRHSELNALRPDLLPSPLGDRSPLRLASTWLVHVDPLHLAGSVLALSVLAILWPGRRRWLLLALFWCGLGGSIATLLGELKSRGYKIVHMKAKGELKTLAEYDAAIEGKHVNGREDDTEGCARRVLEQIQFAPPDRAGALVKEYEP